MNTLPRILVAGIGNIFLGDDAFGSEVARVLLSRPFATRVWVVDFGIRGLDLTYELLENYDGIILIDTCPLGQQPAGTLQVIEPDLSLATANAGDLMIEAHAMDPVRVLQTAASMGARLSRVRLVACQPQSFGTDDDPQMGLSVPVQAAIRGAVELVEYLVEKMLAGEMDGMPVAVEIDRRSPEEASP